MKLSECGEFLILEEGDIIPEGVWIEMPGWSNEGWRKLEERAQIGKTYVGPAIHGRTSGHLPMRLPVDEWRGIRNGVEYRIVRGGVRWSFDLAARTTDPNKGLAGSSLETARHLGRPVSEWNFVFRPVAKTEEIKPKHDTRGLPPGWRWVCEGEDPSGSKWWNVYEGRFLDDYRGDDSHPRRRWPNTVGCGWAKKIETETEEPAISIPMFPKHDTRGLPPGWRWAKRMEKIEESDRNKWFGHYSPEEWKAPIRSDHGKYYPRDYPEEQNGKFSGYVKRIAADDLCGPRDRIFVKPESSIEDMRMRTINIHGKEIVEHRNHTWEIELIAKPLTCALCGEADRGVKIINGGRMTDKGEEDIIRNGHAHKECFLRSTRLQRVLCGLIKEDPYNQRWCARRDENGNRLQGREREDSISFLEDARDDWAPRSKNTTSFVQEMWGEEFE